MFSAIFQREYFCPFIPAGSTVCKIRPNLTVLHLKFNLSPPDFDILPLFPWFQHFIPLPPSTLIVWLSKHLTPESKETYVLGKEIRITMMILIVILQFYISKYSALNSLFIVIFLFALLVASLCTHAVAKFNFPSFSSVTPHICAANSNIQIFFALQNFKFYGKIFSALSSCGAVHMCARVRFSLQLLLFYQQLWLLW